MAAEQAGADNAGIAPATAAMRVRQPLGLPGGSIRALLTLTVVAYVVIRTAQAATVGVLWIETLMIVLAHYFTARRFVTLPPRLRAELEATGRIEPETHPLYLPRHTIRTVIVLAFLALGVYLFVRGRLLEEQSIAILGTVGAYFLGLLVRAAVNWWARRRQRSTPTWWIDLKAVATLLLVLATVILRLAGAGDWLPWPIESMEHLSLALILFYFGSR